MLQKLPLGRVPKRVSKAPYYRSLSSDSDLKTLDMIQQNNNVPPNPILASSQAAEDHIAWNQH